MIETIVEGENAKVAEKTVVEQADTVRTSIASLRRGLAFPAPISQDRILVYADQIILHADRCFETGGALISYGQPYYASVGVAFKAALDGYAEAIEYAPERAAGLRSRVLSWKARLKPWVDADRPTSLLAAQNYFERRHALGLKQLPRMETWEGYRTQEFAISWHTVMGRTSVFVAWFGLFPGEQGIQGNMIGTITLPAGVTFDQAVAAGPRFAVPSWFAVRSNVPPSRADYDECVDQLTKLVIDYYNYPTVGLTARKAASIAQETLRVIDEILQATKDIDLTMTNLLDVTEQSEVDRRAAVDVVLRSHRPGFGRIRTIVT